MKEALNEAVAALRPEMTAALQRLVRKKSVEGAGAARQALRCRCGRLLYGGADPLP